MVNITNPFINLQDVVENGGDLGADVIGGKGVGVLQHTKALRDLKKEDEARIRGDRMFASIDTPSAHVLSISYYERFLHDKDIPVGEDPETIARKLAEVRHDPDMLEGLAVILNEIDGPVIGRSSQSLEDWSRTDGRISSFSGAFGSYPYHNTGKLGDRVRAFAEIISLVYASSFSKRAMDRRQAEGIDDFGQMAVLIQPVIAEEIAPGVVAPPTAAVWYPENPLPWHKNLEHEDGMARVVVGFGSRAVNPAEAFLFAPGRPNIVPDSTDLARRKTQTEMDIIDPAFEPGLDHFINPSGTPGLMSIKIGDLVRQGQDAWQPLYGALEFWDANDSMYRLYPPWGKSPIPTVTFKERRGDLGRRLFRPLRMLHDRLSYAGLTDFEIAERNEQENGVMTYVLQSRPLTLGSSNYIPSTPRQDIDRDRLLLRTREFAVNSSVEEIQYIVFVTPEFFGENYNHARKQVAIELGKLNGRFGKDGSKYVLIGPGRWGNEDGSQGVPVTESEIGNVSALIAYRCETTGATYEPQRNNGEHMFKFFLERGIVPVGLIDTNFDDPNSDNFFNMDLLRKLPNSLLEHLPDLHDSGLEKVISVIDVSKNAALKGDYKRETALYLK